MLKPKNKEPLQHVDATPDADYPIRILKAHLHNAEVVWDYEGEFGVGGKKIINEMNKISEKRRELLKQAISILEGTK